MSGILRRLDDVEILQERAADVDGIALHRLSRVGVLLIPFVLSLHQSVDLARIGNMYRKQGGKPKPHIGTITYTAALSPIHLRTGLHRHSAFSPVHTS